MLGMGEDPLGQSSFSPRLHYRRHLLPQPNMNIRPPDAPRCDDQSTLTFNYRRYVFVLIAASHFLAAVAIFTFGLLRYINSTKSRRLNATVLFDFTKAEQHAPSNYVGTSIISAKLGLSLLIPAALQSTSAALAFFPICDRPPKFYIILQMIFSAFAIVQWVEPMRLAGLELNLRHTQLQQLRHETEYVVGIVVLVIIGLDIFVVASAVAVHAASFLTSLCKAESSILAIHSSVLSTITAILSTALSAYSTSKSMADVTEWVNASHTANAAALYAVGYKELLVCSFVLLSTIFGAMALASQRKSILLGAAYLQGVSVMLLLVHLLTPDRLLAAAHNSTAMISTGQNAPISGWLLLTLYAAIVLLAVGTTVQLCLNVKAVFQFPPVDNYATPIITSLSNLRCQERVPGQYSEL